MGGHRWQPARLRLVPGPRFVMAAPRLNINHVAEEATINHAYFGAAVAAQDRDPAEAPRMWFRCLQAGDSMAHFVLGYTLYELGRFHEAYRHLRYYAGIAPAGAWNRCWLGRAA